LQTLSGISAIALLFVSFSASSQDPCADLTKLNPPQAAACLERKLANAEARLKALEARVLVCTVQRATSADMRNAEIEVQVATGYQRVSGGCKIPRSIQGVPAHNVDNGWRCSVGDPKDFPLTTRVEAYAVGCKLQ
jgi:hypothetical protein